MANEARLNIDKAGKGRYRLAFEAAGGKVVCEVSVQQPGRSDSRTEEEKRLAALHSAKRLVRAFCEGIPTD